MDGLTDGLEVVVIVLKVPGPTERLFTKGGCCSLEVPQLTV